jgi:RHS repeat-associated protein
MVQELTSRVQWDWVWIDDLPVLQYQDSYDAQGGLIGTQTTYLHPDHLGTPRIGTDASQTIQWRYRSDAFGMATITGAHTVRLRMPGQIDLGFGGINYNYFRDYDPNVGRYLESDPIGLLGSLNTYAYVDNNPLRWIDPTGEIKLPNDPSGLPGDWQLDPSHRDPNGERWRHPSGDSLDWHKGRPGMPGWRGKDHWHHNGGNKHLPPGAEVPDPPEDGESCGDECQQKVATVVTTATGVYIVYRCLRMIPSLAPPLWWSIPANAAAP